MSSMEINKKQATYTYTYHKGESITLDLEKNILIDRELVLKSLHLSKENGYSFTTDDLTDLFTRKMKETIYSFANDDKLAIEEAGINEETVSIFTGCIAKQKDVRKVFKDIGFIK